jgi:asparagine synthase (glutamine-hydrolysing)
MNTAIRRRGPDGSGHLYTGNVGLAMRRLAIIDLEGGQQPIYNQSRTAAVVFNGEIYNYRKLREELLSRGHEFATHSDTEVIIHLYDEYGERLVEHLEGMFTFAIWDFPRQRLMLARDRLGIKPLFLAQLPGCIVFGSEIKCLMASGVVPTDVNWNAIDQFFGYTYIPAPLSAYRSIRKILPGTVLMIEADLHVREHRYWTVPDTPVEKRSLEEWTDKIDEGFRSAVESHLVSDVPIGAFLSGGIDSGLMVAQMAALMDRPVDTFTVGFGGAGSAFLDERVYARELAAKFKLNHHEIDVEARVENIIDEIVDAFDEPFADDSVVPSYYVSQVAASRVKVALTGLGGDELFGGYRRHLGIRAGDYYRRIPGVLRERILDPLIRRLPEPKSASDAIDHLKRFSRSSSGSAAHRYQDSLCTLPTSVRAALYQPDVLAQISLPDTDAAITGRFDGWRHGDSVDRALKTDLEVYLPDDILTLTDRLSMWHSLELRVPFLDRSFVELAMRVPADLKIRGTTQKYLLKRVASKYLPPSVINHKKQGFEAPMGRWLRGPLRPMLEATLDRSRIEAEGIFRHEAISHLVNEHLSGAAKHSKILFSLLMFHLWRRRAQATT